jgi:hypothetical protein
MTVRSLQEVGTYLDGDLETAWDSFQPKLNIAIHLFCEGLKKEGYAVDFRNNRFGIDGNGVTTVIRLIEKRRGVAFHCQGRDILVPLTAHKQQIIRSLKKCLERGRE